MKYLDRTNVLLLLAAACGLLLAACTAQEAVATIAGASVGVGAILDAVAPILSPEDFAKLRGGLDAIDGTVDATRSVVSAVVDAFAQFRDHVADVETARAAQAHAMEVALAGKASTAEVVGISGATGAGGAAVSRVLSVLKHGPGKVPMQAPTAAPTPKTPA